MKGIISIILLSITTLSIAQTNLISGSVNDQQNTPVEFANVLLLLSKDSALVKGNITDEKGFFSFENIPSNEYIISINQIGMEKYYSEKFLINEDHSVKDLGEIVIKNETSTLKEVVITSKTPLFERKPDKTVVNVSSDIAASNSTALDVLTKSPGVMVDKDGNISMRGKSGVMVMIDGKQTFLSAEQLTNMLNAMSADQIEQIELITNPSSKYDAEGTAGIINLKLKKSKMYGTNGSLSLGYSQGNYDRENGSINLNHRTEKLNLFGNYNFNSFTTYNKIIIERKFVKNGSLDNVFKQDSWIKEGGSGNALKTGADYFINDNNTLGVIANLGYYPENRTGTNYTSIYNSQDVFSSAVHTFNKNKLMFGNYSMNLNYESKLDTSGTKLNIDADYAKFETENNGSFQFLNYDSIYNQTGNENEIKNDALSLTTIQSIKADLIKPLFNNKWKLETGAKASIVDTDNDLIFYNILNNTEILDTSKSNHFKYSENIFAAYGMMGREWKKLTLQVGLRGEQTIAKGYQETNDSSFTRSYFQLFPTASASFLPSEKHQWGISYSRRIDRPDYNDMNPFRFFLDQYTYQQGNPFLRPQFSNNYEFSYTYMQSLSGVLSYSRTRDNITDVTKQDDITHVTYVTKENLDINDNYSLTLSFPLPVAEWLTSNNSVTAFYNHFNSELSGGTINRGSLNYMINTSNQIKLPKKTTAQVDFFYNSSMVYAIFHMTPRYGLNLALQKKILNERGKIKISVRNLIRNEYMGADIKYENIDFFFRQKRDNRIFNISFTYTFGKTTVAQSRNRSTGADDEKNRVKQQ